MMKIFNSLFLFLLLIAGSPVFAVDINTADADTIAAELNGVGQSKAVAIVKYRDENGPFKSVDELAQVEGIGQKTVEKNRAKVSIK